MDYTHNETALLTLISNINNQFYYIGEEDDKVAPIDVKKFTEQLPLIHWRSKDGTCSTQSYRHRDTTTHLGHQL